MKYHTTVFHKNKIKFHPINSFEYIYSKLKVVHILCSISESIGNKPFVVRFAHQGENVRVWARTVDRRDGSYVVQYKLFESFSSLAISLTLGSNKRHVGASPYMLSSKIKTFKIHDVCAFKFCEFP